MDVAHRRLIDELTRFDAFGVTVTTDMGLDAAKGKQA